MLKQYYLFKWGDAWFGASEQEYNRYLAEKLTGGRKIRPELRNFPDSKSLAQVVKSVGAKCIIVKCPIGREENAGS